MGTSSAWGDPDPRFKSSIVSLKKNVVANYCGQGWQALMGLAFVPLYIRYLGIEAYGLIGIFALLQAWLTLIDMGMKPALSREMARFTAGAHNAQSIRNLLRSVEIIGIAIAGVIVLSIWASSGWLAVHWVTPKTLSVEVVAQAFVVMGVVTGLRFIENIYVSSIVGLQRQVLQNVAISMMATMRGLGAVIVLAWVSPTISGFFFWQGVVSLLTVALVGRIVYRTLPPAPLPTRFSGPALMGIWRFAAGMMTITLLSLLLTQIDKILLSRLLTLQAYGYSALAGVVVSGLYSLVSPITAAFYPRFTGMVTSGNHLALRDAYHEAAQLVTVLMGSAAIVLSVFGSKVMMLWTGDPQLVQEVAPLVAVLALGTLLNGLMWIPYQTMLAHGWTILTIRANIVAVIILLPTLLWVVPRHGAIGAAWIWVMLNAGNITCTISLMHRRLLPLDKWRWYGQDVGVPLVAAAAAALLCHRVMPRSLGRPGEVVLLAGMSASVLLASAVAAPAVRSQLIRYARGAIGHSGASPHHD